MDWSKRLNDLKTPNMRIITDYDICPAFYVSDLLVSDVSSVSYEYCTLDRPMIFYHVDQMVDRIEKKERERWGNETSDLLAWGRGCGQVVFNVPEMKAAIEHGLAHPGEKSAIRQDFAQKFFYNLGGATDKAVAKMYEFLELEP